jgi:dipeptidase
MRSWILALLLVLPASAAFPCTSILVSRGASADGSVMVTYVADSHELYGDLALTPAGLHAPGAVRDIYEWDTGKYLGKIPQVPQTYAVLGNMNEHQLVISETTFDGREELKSDVGVLDYGSLMALGLERARTAREAIGVMTSLAQEYGYISTGELFSLGDTKEAWLLAMMGKGPGVKGAVWVALRVPDGYLTAHANYSRIGKFPLKDPKNCLYSQDVIEFARSKGFFKGTDADFSFSDAYMPLDWATARYCEARVWQIFRRAAPSSTPQVDFLHARSAADVALPLWVKPDRPLTQRDVMELMRDHFEGTPMDLSKGVGAGPYQWPYRWRPMEWKVGEETYLHERATSTQQTAFSFVSQSRDSLPDPIGGVLWFGVDDTFSTVYVPMYCGLREVPHNFARGTGGFRQFSWDSAFWVFNWVSNFAYTRYSDIIPIVRQVQGELEGSFLARQGELEASAVKVHAQSPEDARALLTRYSGEAAARTHQRWSLLGQELLMKFLDGNLRDNNGAVTHPAYDEGWYRRIIQEDGENLKMRKFEEAR